MPYLIPTTQDVASSITVTLGDSTYKIRTRWNERSESWFIAVETVDGDVIINFERITAHQAIVNYNQDKFQGQLFLIPEEEERIPLNRTNFGQNYTYRLWYFNEDDLEILDEFDQLIAGGYFV